MTVAVVGASGLTGSAFCDIAADKLPRLRLIGKSTVGTPRDAGRQNLRCGGRGGA